MATADPWNWCTNDLVHHLCRTTAIYAAVDRAAPSYNDRLLLEDQLWRQHTTGADLMRNADFTALPQIPSHTLLLILRELRLRSPSYLEYQKGATITGVQALNISNDNTQSLIERQEYNEAVFSEDNTRKRRRISMIDTVSLPASRVAQQSADPSSSNVQLATSSAQNWDHLRHWQQGEYANEDIVDLEDTATDSDYPEDEVMEDEDDAHDEVVVEEQEITPSTRPRQGKLSDEEIVEIINEEISRFEARWRPGSEINPDELWEKAENDGQREQLINQSRTTIEWLQSRLEAMGDRIRALDCNSVRELRTQCKSLEGTVDQLQEAEWILSIYELELEDEESSVENSVGQHGTAEIIDLGSGSDSDAEDGMLVPGSTAFTVTTPESMLGVEASIEPHVEHTPPHAPKSNLEPHIEPSSEICKTPPIPNRLADNPGLASINSVSRWDWNTLVEKKDRKRIVMKAMQEMRWEDREMIRTRVKNIKKQNLLLEIPQCISMFIRGDKKIPGHLPAEMPKIITFTKLFLSWWLADDYFKKEATEWRLEELSECLDAGSEDPTIFYEWVRHILNNTFSLQALSKPCAPSQAEIICISDDDEPRPVPPTRRKSASNRRRPVQRPPRTPPETIELD